MPADLQAIVDRLSSVGIDAKIIPWGMTSDAGDCIAVHQPGAGHIWLRLDHGDRPWQAWNASWNQQWGHDPCTVLAQLAHRMAGHAMWRGITDSPWRVLALAAERARDAIPELRSVLDLDDGEG